MAVITGVPYYIVRGKVEFRSGDNSKLMYVTGPFDVGNGIVMYKSSKWQAARIPTIEAAQHAAKLLAEKKVWYGSPNRVHDVEIIEVTEKLIPIE